MGCEYREIDVNEEFDKKRHLMIFDEEKNVNVMIPVLELYSKKGWRPVHINMKWVLLERTEEDRLKCIGCGKDGNYRISGK